MIPFCDNNVLDTGAVVGAEKYTLLLEYVHEPGHHDGLQGARVVGVLLMVHSPKQYSWSTNKYSPGSC